MVRLTSLAFATTTFLFQLAQGQSSREWQQCGGIGYSGLTDCPAGWTCNPWNDWYYYGHEFDNVNYLSEMVSTYTGASTSFVVSSCPTPATDTVSKTSSSLRYLPS
ncbi:hypothetical protein M407DRAFT_29937 [Tulasnella calospora MUT 4182]|uniref:CBM1 domain-containing protein n=1 Tax=Tulasnella calospora MUT 4182 TaxID=1051891 RepID=A0A0C3PYM2_9AGAM|nr:hypothetical protein M407DRAFT_29937 [Tulasnella calospora MUT 4182]